MGAAGSAQQTLPAAQARTRRWVGALLRRLALPVALIALVALRLLVVGPIAVSSNSMEPTLRPDDRVVALSLRFGVSAERGDLVTFQHPTTQELTLKRIAGTAGDTVAIKDGRLFVNGVRAQEPYVDHRTVDSVFFGPVRVPADSVFVLGDARAISEDSRDYGSVPVSELSARVAFSW